MSREGIAAYLGLNAESVSRILTRLKKFRLVKVPLAQ
jgi:CRP-like cAMP-binding protein